MFFGFGSGRRWRSRLPSLRHLQDPSQHFGLLWQSISLPVLNLNALELLTLSHRRGVVRVDYTILYHGSINLSLEMQLKFLVLPSTWIPKWRLIHTFAPQYNTFRRA